MAVNDIRWQFAQPGIGENLRETHCSICFDEGDVNSILAHPLNRGREEQGPAPLGHRVHRACLLAYQRDQCPLCQAHYNRWDIPGALAERAFYVLDMVGADFVRCVRIGLFYNALFFATVCIGLTPLLDPNGASLFLFTQFGASALVGLPLGAAAITFAGCTFWYGSRHVIHLVNPQNPTVRRALVIAAAIFTVAAAFYASSLFLHGIEANILAKLTPEAQAWYYFFMTQGQSAIPTEAVSSAFSREAATVAYNKLAGLWLGLGSAFVGASTGNFPRFFAEFIEEFRR